MDLRKTELETWVSKVLKLPKVSLEMVSGDASFRRYFRACIDGRTWIAMDAPPEKENSSSFVAIAKYWLSKGIQVPLIYDYDLDLGFLLLNDFGDVMLLPLLCPNKPNVEKGDQYYQKTMDILLDIQAINPNQSYALPLYNSALLQGEMALFPDWFLTSKLGLELSTSEEQMLKRSFEVLENNALSQVQVPVHRDYHARNLMVLKDDSIGVIDFQDAVLGPVTYDLVSLLRDCYIVWPDEKVTQWCRHYYDLLLAQQRVTCEWEQFKEWFDLMGVQRHLKVAGIFSRLSLRDGKHGYLDDIPVTVNYLVKVSANYSALKDLHVFLKTRVLPVLTLKLKDNVPV